MLQDGGCDDANKVSFYADSDERTRETAKALAEGLLPGCKVAVEALPEGTNDPLFHFHPAAGQAGFLNPTAAVAAIRGRIGADPANLTEAYRTQIGALDRILATCGVAGSPQAKRVSLYDVPSSLDAGAVGHAAELHSPLNIASTLVENILLEYTQGMEPAKVAWGCVDGAKLRSLMELHTAATDFTERTQVIAQAAASNLLWVIERSMDQAVTGKEVAGARGKPGDRALFLIGHDTNLTNIAGVLNMTWIIDGRRDDTPPGGALLFELWQDQATREYSMRTYFTAQTLEQMRTSATHAFPSTCRGASRKTVPARGQPSRKFFSEHKTCRDIPITYRVPLKLTRQVLASGSSGMQISTGPSGVPESEMLVNCSNSGAYFSRRPDAGSQC